MSKAEEFKAELKALLTKYNAEIAIEDAGTNWDEHKPYFEISIDGHREFLDIQKTTIYSEML